MYDLFPTVIFVGLQSRIILLALYVLSDYLIFDHNATDVLLYEPFYSHLYSRLILRGFTKWDAAHFLSIAQDNYQYEQSWAFFPVLPYLIKFLAQRNYPTIRTDETYIISGIAISNISFIGSCCVLTCLCLQNGLSKKQTVTVICFYCVNPANIFFSSIYTESLFSFLSWLGIYLLHCSNLSSRLLACIPFFLASYTRSNGTLNVIFVVFSYLSFLSQKQLAPTTHGNHVCKSFISTSIHTATFFFLCISTISPYILHNLAAMRAICPTTCPALAAEGHCISSSDAFTDVYSYVQDKYWDVGPFRYYRVRQIPNWLLAAPMLYLGWLFVYCHFHVISRQSSSVWMWLMEVLAQRQTAHASHMAVLLILALTMAHIEITTRLVCSACPMIHVFLADLAAKPRHYGISRIILFSYFILFNVLGLLLHPNRYPWT